MAYDLFSILPIVIIVTVIIKYFVVIESKLPVENKGKSLLNHLLYATKNIDIKKRQKEKWGAHAERYSDQYLAE